MRLAALAPLVSSGALLLGFPSLAAAQAPSIDLRGWHASPDAEAGMTLEPVSAPDTGEWNVGLRASWSYRPFELESSTGVVVVPIEHQLASDLVAGVGIGRRLLLGMDLPYVIAQAGEDVTDPGILQALGTSGAPVVAVLADQCC